MKICKWMPLLTIFGVGLAAQVVAEPLTEPAAMVEETVVLADDEEDDENEDS